MAYRSLLPTFHDDESPASAVSRIAALAGRGAADFCLDMGLSLSGIANGDPGALDALIDTCGLKNVPGTSLVYFNDRVVISGQTMMRGQLSRQRLRICPACLMQDLAHGTDRKEVRAYGRTAWLVAPIRTCTTHGQKLVEVPGAEATSIHDVARLTQPIAELDMLEGMMGKPRPPSGLEIDLYGRLAGRLPVPGWLAPFPAYAACRISETIGAIAKHGTRFRSDDFDEDEWWDVGRAGFEIANAGPERISEVLRDALTNFSAKKGPWGGRKVFGRLYEWLSHESDDPVYEPLRDILRAFAIDNLPLGPGDDFLGRPVPHRVVQSVHSLHKETAAHPKRLRKILFNAGIIDGVGMSDERTTFSVDAATVERFATEMMTLRAAARHLNMPRPHERMLVEHDFVRPTIKGSKRGPVKHAFLRSDLDAFLTAMTAGATPLRVEDGQLYDLLSAAKRTNRPVAAIVELLLAGRLKAVHLDPAERGFKAIRVDPSEIKPLVRGEEHDARNLRDVSKVLQTNDRVVKALVDRGHLPARRAINPINGCPQTAVDQCELDAFSKNYVSLTVLSRETGCHFRRLGRLLASKMVVPAFDPDAVEATFFNRRETNRALGVE